MVELSFFHGDDLGACAGSVVGKAGKTAVHTVLLLTCPLNSA